MATKKKMLQAAAGNAGGAALDITDVFSTYLYTGNDGILDVTNNIDLAGEGGMIWHKARTPYSGSSTGTHTLWSSETVGNLNSTNTDALNNTALQPTFNDDGYTFPSSSWVTLNSSASDYVGWTFRKAPKFFDVVTYTGNRVNTSSFQDIPHNLGSTPGMIIVKETSSADDWMVYHRSVSVDGTVFKLNTTDAATNFGNVIFDVSEINDSTFRVGNMNNVNANGSTYVAYLFAHNNGDGEFGPNADQDIIKCGSYTGNGADARTIGLGFEAQWVLLKRSDGATDWWILDNMRGLPARPEASQYLEANTANAEAVTGQVFGDNQGFMVDAGDYNTSGENYIYMAIRRGPLAQPESGTEVFAIDTYGGAGGGVAPAWRSGFPVDMAYYKDAATTSNNWNMSRLTGTDYLFFDSTNAASQFPSVKFDYNNGYWGNGGTAATTYSWMWKRAPGFFDVVAYSGNVTLDNVPHNLGAIPEMVWTKCRGNTYDWGVYHKDIGVGSASGADGTGLILNTNIGLNAGADSPLKVLPTSEVFQPFGSQDQSFPYIAYLFATLPGISKVGSYTGNGSSQTIDCGFTSGARFVLIKRTDSTGDWYVWDTERGIVAGNDPYLELNTTDAEVTSTDWVDPDNSGFIVNGTTINASSAEYIFYAVS